MGACGPVDKALDSRSKRLSFDSHCWPNFLFHTARDANQCNFVHTGTNFSPKISSIDFPKPKYDLKKKRCVCFYVAFLAYFK